MKKRVAIHNLGCKVNAYEAEAMQQLLVQAGYEIVPFEERADVYLINTCTVTNIADRKSRQMLHRARKLNPGAVVAAAGCYAQTDADRLLADGTADIVIGNNQKKDIVKVLREYEETACRSAHVVNMNRVREYEDLSVSCTAENVRVYIKVQDGCNQFCTYCIIPYARGRVRSRSSAEIVAEAESLAKKGYKEVVLTGIHLSSYGADFPDGQKETLLDLIRAVHQVEGICRIRLGSLEPGIITEEFVRELASLPKVCPHFHLSLQSGCDETLKRMNRRYDSAEYAEKCAFLRKAFENPALTTDVIVGFPMETEEDFRKSLEFVKSIHFYETHIFKYSRRRGTKAASMEGQLTEAVKAERSDQMLRLHERRAAEYESSFLGKDLEVLLEEEMVVDGAAYLVGHSREYLKVAVKKDGKTAVNDLRTVKAEGFLGEHLLLGTDPE